ncbi:MAG TPA: LamG domain-containing protein [Actinomycetales bacterium]|nr:LamG domain-containing protein [Actinomycetales bacterium]
MRKLDKLGRRAGAAALAPLASVALVASPAHAATASVRLTFSSMTNDGSAPLNVDIARSGGGTVSTKSDAAWLGQVGRTPSFNAQKGAPRGVLRLTAKSGDPLSPGSRSFSFGADVLLDSGTTASHTSGSTDNGDNVVQRGRYGDQGQYKIQVDGRRPSCRVKGSSGAVLVKSSVSLAAGTWYQITCTRSGTAVTLQVLRFTSTGAVAATTKTTGYGATGSVLAPGSRPMSVGGKLTTSGQVATDSDQFNGRVDNVVLTIS